MTLRAGDVATRTTLRAVVRGRGYPDDSAGWGQGTRRESRPGSHLPSSQQKAILPALTVTSAASFLPENFNGGTAGFQ